MSNKSLVEGGIPLPNGARLIEASEFRVSTVKPDDTIAERLVLDVNGRNVQILRYDRNDGDVVVYVGTKSRTMHMNKVNGYIGKEVS